MVYIQGVDDVIKAYALQLDPATNTMLLNETPVSEGDDLRLPREVSSVSADGTSNGIVWSARTWIRTSRTARRSSKPTPPTTCLTPLYTNAQAGPRDTAGGAIKFSVPTIANGHVYLGLRCVGLTPTDSSRRRAASRPPSLSGNRGRLRRDRGRPTGASGVSSPPPHPPAPRDENGTGRPPIVRARTPVPRGEGGNQPLVTRPGTAVPVLDQQDELLQFDSLRSRTAQNVIPDRVHSRM